MNLVLLEVGCILTMENHTTPFHYFHYFLYKSALEHSDCLRADAGVGASGRQSLVSCFKETQAGEVEKDGRWCHHDRESWSHLLELDVKACWWPRLQNPQRRGFYNVTVDWSYQKSFFRNIQIFQCSFPDLLHFVTNWYLLLWLLSVSMSYTSGVATKCGPSHPAAISIAWVPTASATLGLGPQICV